MLRYAFAEQIEQLNPFSITCYANLGGFEKPATVARSSPPKPFFLFLHSRPTPGTDILRWKVGPLLDDLAEIDQAFGSQL